jgi:PAS domain S-box-containing protein
VIDLLNEGVCVIGVDGRITETNRCFEEMVGLSKQQMAGLRAPFPWWPSSNVEALDRVLKSALATGSEHHELQFMRHSGELFPVSLDATRTGEDGEQDSELIAVIRDTSVEVEERRRRRESERVAKLATWEWDPVTDLVTGSTALALAGGIKWDGARPLDAILGLMSGADAERGRGKMESVATGRQEEFAFEVAVNTPNPEIGWLEIRGRAVHDDSGVVTAVRGITRDVTERRSLDAAFSQNRELLQMAERVADIGSFEVDERTGVTRWSENLYTLWGVEPGDEDLRGLALKKIHEDDLEAFLGVRNSVRDDGVPRMVDHRYLRGEEVRWAETRFEPLRDEGAIIGIRGTLQDLTERHRTDERVRLQARLLDVVDAAVIATGLDGLVTQWNLRAEQLYGWSREEAIGKPISILTADLEAREKVKEILSSVKHAGTWTGGFDVRRKDSTAFTALVQISAYTDDNGNPAGLLGTSMDLSEHIDLEEQLRAARDYMLAVTDSIGEGVFTLDEEGRLVLMNHAAQEILGWRREELLGRAFHDVVQYRRSDGSDYPIEECSIAASRHGQEPVRVEEDLFIAKNGAEIPVEYTAAPIETKEGAKGSVVVFSDISDQIAQKREIEKRIESLSWIGRIHSALEEDRFEVYAQPIIDLAGGAVVQHELLIRMREEDGTLVPPGQFLPAAEEFGVISEIDRWMIGQAAELAGAGHPVHLNLSADSVGGTRAIGHLCDALGRTGADPHDVVVELTETAMLENEGEAEKFAARLHEIGCGLALDDFGTGYGSFSYLKRLRVDYLKIDREFVSDLAENDASRYVVEAVVRLAGGFGQKTVAEGVEDQETLDLLRELGVDYAQGFHIARPGPVEKILNQKDPKETT